MHYQDDLVSFIIRICSQNRIDNLYEAVKSIIKNEYRPLEIIIVVQNEDTHSFEERIRFFIEQYQEKNLTLNVCFNQTGKDERARNLNIGLQHATGRYISFLDDDDIIYPTYISSMLEKLKTCQNAWIYGDVDVSTYENGSESCSLLIRDNRFKRRGFSYSHLFFENYIPIHSFMIDRYRIQKSELYFDETVECLEDYIFLVIFAFRYKPSYLNEKICEYRIRLDGSNSVMIGTGSSLKLEKWKNAENKLNRAREKILNSPEFQSYSFHKYLLIKYNYLKKIGKLNRISRPSLSSQNKFLMAIKRKFPYPWHVIGSFLSKSGIN